MALLNGKHIVNKGKNCGWMALMRYVNSILVAFNRLAIGHIERECIFQHCHTVGSKTANEL